MRPAGGKFQGKIFRKFLLLVRKCAYNKVKNKEEKRMFSITTEKGYYAVRKEAK